MLKKIVIAVLLLAGLGWLLLQSEAVQDRLMASVAEQRMAANSEALFDPDSLNVLLCGSTSPFPSPVRAGPCVAVFAGGKFYIIDTGNRSWNTLALRGVPARRVGAVFLTHFHSDHIAELGEYNMQTWAAGRPAPLPVYGGDGIAQVVAGFELAYQADRGYRVAHHGADYLDPDKGRMQARAVNADAGPVTILEDGALTVTAFKVDHAPIEPALGYRFDYRGRSVVISGDTVKSASLTAAAKGADLLFHEAQAQHMVDLLHDTAQQLGNEQMRKIFHDIKDYHTSPVEAAEVANEAGVQELVFYHLTPPPPNRIAEKIFLRGVADTRADGVTLGRDGLFWRLPADSDAIEASLMKPL